MGDAHRHGDFRHGRSAAMGREQVVLAHHPEHPLAGNTDAGQTRCRAQTLRCPSPRRGMPPGRPMATSRASSEIERASVPGALLVGAQRWPAAGISWRRTRTGKTPGRTDPLEAVGQTRAGRGGGSSPRPPPPQRARIVSVLASSRSTCMINSPIRYRDVQFRPPNRPCALSEASIPCSIAFSRATCSSRKISTPNCPTKVPPARHEPQGKPRARHRPAEPSPSGPTARNLARGKRGRAKLALVYHRPINSNFVRRASVMFRSSLDTSIKPMLCPRKSGRDSDECIADRISSAGAASREVQCDVRGGAGVARRIDTSTSVERVGAGVTLQSIVTGTA